MLPPFNKLVQKSSNFSGGKLAEFLHQEVVGEVGVVVVVDGFLAQQILTFVSKNVKFVFAIKDIEGGEKTFNVRPFCYTSLRSAKRVTEFLT
jgi:hypothetical protein